MIDSILILLAFQVAGESISYLFSLPIPGPVIGMLLLFIYLMVSRREHRRLHTFSTRFLSHLALLFVPAATGIMLHFEQVGKEWMPILVALVVSTILAIVVTGLVLRKADHDR
jgi:holin-like protein